VGAKWWVQLDDPKIFPQQYGAPFPPNFEEVVRTIFKRLFRVYAHMYHSHFKHVCALGEEAHLNTCFKHFVYFTQVPRLLRLANSFSAWQTISSPDKQILRVTKNFSPWKTISPPGKHFSLWKTISPPGKHFSLWKRFTAWKTVSPGNFAGSLLWTLTHFLHLWVLVVAWVVGCCGVHPRVPRLCGVSLFTSVVFLVASLHFCHVFNGSSAFPPRF
jgi:Mob1/phocein family